VAAESLPAATFAVGILTSRNGVCPRLQEVEETRATATRFPAVYQEQSRASRLDTND
jgi:hypothetical protein